MDTKPAGYEWWIKVGAVPIDEHMAMMRMLVKRASLWDRLFALTKPGHWLNHAKKILLLYSIRDTV